MTDNKDLIELTSEGVVFYYVALLHGFRAAATHLAISKSVISSKVAALETRIGKRLLYRSTRDVSLTPEGERYFETCKALIQAATALKNSEAEFRSELSGTFTISAPHDFMTIWLIPTLAKFQALHPKLKINLLAADQVMNLEKNKIDLAIRLGADGSGHLFKNSFCTLEFGFFCRKDLVPEKLSASETLDWLQEQGVHVFRPAREKSFRLGDESFDVRVQTKFQVHDVLSLKSLVMAGVGIGILPKFSVADEVRSGLIAEVLPLAKIKGITAAFYSGARKQDDARLEAVISFLSSATIAT